MKNVFRILKRDIVRLLKAPAALIVVVALIIIPSLYTWINVYGFWDPYGNTGKMRVCFANEDVGATTELTGYMNVGQMIDEELHENTQLGWAFVSREEALEEVRSGKAYAAFIVGSDFSENVMSLMSSEFKQPKVEYYVNEKVSAVSPKVTDSGSTTLDETINSTFVSTVSETVAKTLGQAMAETGTKVDDSRNDALGKVAEARNIVANSKESLAQLDGDAQKLQDKLADARTKLDEVKPAFDDVQAKLAAVQEKADAATNSLESLLEKALPAAGDAAGAASGAALEASAAISEMSTSIQNAKVDMSAVTEQEKLVIDHYKLLLEQINTLVDKLPDGEAKDRLAQRAAELSERISQAESSMSQIEEVAGRISSGIEKASSLSSQMNSALQEAAGTTTLFTSTLYQTLLPQIEKNIRESATAAQSLADAGVALSGLVDQTRNSVDQVDSAVQAARSSIQATSGSLDIFDGDLASVQGDLSAVATSAVIDKLLAGNSIDAETIGDFIGAPTKVQTESLYSLNAYGSAMAPLFMNLTFWIGAFMLLVILRQEVDAEGIANLTIKQRYIARWLLLSVFAVAQALLCVAGVLVLGVQTVNMLALFAMSALCSITYLSIMFMLATTLQHIGKGLCVLLAFLQIPGATGLYPIEMTVPFFQAIYPFFPFTYGINGLREAICGFYGNEFAICAAALGAFLASSMFVGIYLRPFLTNFNKLFAKQIREGGIFAGEEIEIPTQRFRLAQLVGYISGRKEYKANLERRAARFTKHYTKFKHYALGIGIAVSLVIAVFFSRMPVAYKPSLLSAWLCALILTALVVVFIEHTYDSLERQLSLDDLSDEELKGLAASRDEVGKTTSELFRKQRDGQGKEYVEKLVKGKKKGKKSGTGKGEAEKGDVKGKKDGGKGKGKNAQDDGDKGGRGDKGGQS